MNVGSFTSSRIVRCICLFTVITCTGCSSIFVRTPLDTASRGECFGSTSASISTATNPKAGHHFQRVVFVVLENQNYDDVLNDANFKRLSKQGAVLANFHGLFHPSYSNYLAMVAGTEIQTFADIQVDINRPTIACRLTAKGYSWKSYAEGYPEVGDPMMPSTNCFTDSSNGPLYARKHVPLLSFISIQKDDCANVVSGAQFWRDAAANVVPHYAFYTPDLQNDGHNPTSEPLIGLANASTWLADRFLKPLLRDDSFMNGTLIVVTFDESSETDADNHIYTVLLGPMVRPNTTVSDSYNHYNLLRTIEDNFELGTLADGDGGAKPLPDAIWR